ncbi:alpha-galactosidase [Brachybacterium alimentarium]|uniref:alpha-galactosidase n=1 Tax=Brachybacterium alimentarium TaxID=47845 RepID=UPI002163910F|nr:alpha-galactosidase [Brachybacterium alimentarium]
MLSSMIRITFVGAGSVVFTRQLLADLLRYDDLPTLELRLFDIDERRLQVAQATAHQVSERLGRPMDVIATTDRRQALAETDFVINMVQIGGFEATRKDLEIPERYGLHQTIGDTTGVGGVFRALRTFPFLSALTADMREVAPTAILLNYTNPMAMNIWWAHEVAPDITALGLCHSVYWTAHDLADLVGVDVERTRYRAAGVNHQAWMLEWTHEGEDLYPRLRERIRQDPDLESRVRVEMFRRVGYYPTETSEHSSEYLPWFLRSPEQIERFRLQPLEYVGISEQNVADFEAAERDLAAGRNLRLEQEAAEYAPQVIHSLVTGTEREIHANVVNVGLIENLPQGCVVEVPTLVGAGGIRPQAMGALPLPAAAINRPYVSVNELTVEAARTGDPKLVRQAVLVDPNASSTLTPAQIWDLCNDLVDAHGELLPEALRGRLSPDAL